MRPGVTKLSIRVPTELALEVRRRVGTRGLSGCVARAIAHELEREQLGGLLDEFDEALGPVSKAALAGARTSWPRR